MVMKKIMMVLIIIGVSTMANAQMDNPLKEGMPNTVKLASGEVVYDLNGDWISSFDTGGWGTLEDIVKITQNDNQFVGIYLLKGDRMAGKNKEKIKGKINGNVIDEVYFYDVENSATWNPIWAPSEAKISEDGNELVIKRIWVEKGSSTTRTFSLKRK
jgi:hypothetical protein